MIEMVLETARRCREKVLRSIWFQRPKVLTWRFETGVLRDVVHFEQNRS